MGQANKLAIVGAGNLGREIAWIIERINSHSTKPIWDLLGFFDNDENKKGKRFQTFPVLGNLDQLIHWQDTIYIVCAIAQAKIRKQLTKKLDCCTHIHYATIIDPSAIIADSCSIGEGSIFCAQTIATIDISMGKHVIVDFGSMIGHDTKIGDCTTLCPKVNISGNAVVGNCVEFGAGSQMIQKLSVGDGTIVGAGATVIHSLPENCTAVGIPARPIKFHQSDETSLF